MVKKAKTTKGKGKGNHSGLMRGRPPSDSQELRREITRECEKMICAALPRLIENMIKLANGGYERVELEYTANEFGELNLAKRKVCCADPDRFANQYLIDRIMGKTRQSVEINASESLLAASQLFVIPDVDDRPEPNSQG